MVQFASYLRRVLCKTRLLFPRINGPNIPFTPKKGQSENPLKCRNFILQNAKKQILQKVKVLPKRFHLSGHDVGFLPQTQKLEPPYNSGIERVKTNNFRLPKNEKKGGLKKLNITYTCTYTHHHHQKGLNDVILCSLPMTGHCR